MHLKNLKPSPVASPIVDACIECGFCESNCPSRDVTLTPRQRITSFREMSRLEGMHNRTAEEEERCAPFSRWPFAPLIRSWVGSATQRGGVSLVSCISCAFLLQ